MKGDIEKSVRRAVARQLEMNVDYVEMGNRHNEIISTGGWMGGLTWKRNLTNTARKRD